MKYAIITLGLLVACQDKKLILEPGGYIDDTIARSQGIDREDFDHGGWRFGDIDLELMLQGRHVLREPRARISGTVVGEQFAHTRLIYTSADASAAGAFRLFGAVVEKLRAVGFAEKERLPSSPADLEPAGVRAGWLDISFAGPEDSLTVVGILCGWGKIGPDIESFVEVSFMAKEFIPYR